MLECPELSVLEGDASAAVRAHVAVCSSCRVVVELLDERRRGVDALARRDECARFEMLLAAREEGTISGAAGVLLEAHIRECADCQAVAATMPPATERRQHSSLPPVNTAAYALGREVARGGMGRILEALDVRIGRPVAVKELLGKAPALAARFEREARVTARLQHPGIVPIYEIGTWPDGTPFYAMRMIEGRTLRDEIRNKHSLDERLALLPAVLAAADAVAFAHGKKIIHRDLTPTNILVGEYGDTVVIDWGLAKDLAAPVTADDETSAGPYREASTGEGSLTIVGAVLGTAAYMPPEQASGAAVDERADVYSLGAILYHVLAGEAPYHGTRSDEIVRQVREIPPPLIGDVVPGAPLDLASIVDKAMTRDPRGRYASARELVDELRRFQTGRLVEAHHYSRRERARRWLGRHRGLAIGAGTALVALAVVGSIALAGILAARDRAETGERDAIQQRGLAEQTSAELLEEQGRQTLLHGNPVRAAVWLSAAYSAGDARPSLRVLLGMAMRDVESIERRLECGSPVRHIHVSPDKTMVLVGCDRAARVWRVADGALLHELTGDGATFGRATFSHDGKRIATEGTDGLVRLWDVSSGTLEHVLGDRMFKLTNLEFTADDRRIVAGSDERVFRVWDAESGKLERVVDVATAAQGNRVTVNPLDDQRLVTTSADPNKPTDGVIKVWNVQSGTLLRTIDNHSVAIGVQQLGDHRIMVCGFDGVARLWDLESGELVRAFSGHSDTLWACLVTPDQRRLVTAGSDRTAKVWDIESGLLLHTMQHDGFVMGAALANDGRTVVTNSLNGGLSVWDVDSGILLGADDTGGGTAADALAVAGDRIFAGDGTNVAVYRGLGRSRHVFHPPKGMTVSQVSDDGTRAAVVTPDGAATVWNIEANVIVPHEPLRQPLAESANRLVGRSGDGVAIIDMHSGATLARLAIEAPGEFELGDDGRFLLVHRDGAQAEAWDVAAGKLVKRWDALDVPTGIATGKDRVVLVKDPVKDDVPAEVWALDPPRVIQRLALGRTKKAIATFDRDRSHVILLDGAFPHGVRVFDLATGLAKRTIVGAIAWGFDEQRSVVAVVRSTPGVGRPETTISIVRVSDGTTIAQLPWGLAIGWMGLSRGGELVAGADLIASDLEVVDATGRVLTATPVRALPTYTINSSGGGGSVQLGEHPVRFSSDGVRMISQMADEVITVDLTAEQRSPDEIARVVGARTPLRVERGQIAPVRTVPAALRGRVTRNGAPVAGATVIVNATDGFGLGTVAAAADGTYEVRDLAAGEISLSAESVSVGAFTRFRPVTLAAGDNRVDLELDLAGSIAGQVVDENDRPVAGAHVHADCTGCAATDSGDDTTGPDGHFELRALMGGGAYTLHALKIGVEEHLLEPVAGQAPIVVRDGKDHVSGVRFVVKQSGK